MIGKKALIALAVTTALGVLGAAAASAKEMDNRSRDHGGYVVPCSLDGVNPAYHPEIFGSAATAATYGFFQSADRTWHVRPDCRR